MEPERGPKFQCLLCKKQLSGELDEHFTQHMAWHNVTFNLEFLYATFFLDARGIEKTVEFMLNSANHDEDQPIHSTTPADDGSNPSAEIENTIDEELTEPHTNQVTTTEDMESDVNHHPVDDTDHIKSVDMSDTVITTINLNVVSEVSDAIPVILEATEEQENPSPPSKRSRRSRRLSLDTEDESADPLYLDSSRPRQKYRHRNSKSLSCDCNISFPDDRARKKHINKYHNKFPCPQCNLTFKTRAKLEQHLDNPKDKHDPDYMSTDCSICGIRCKSYRNLRDHKRIVHEVGEFKSCPYCHELVSNLRKHIRSNHVSLKECSICGKKVKNLPKHFLNKHGSEEDRKYRCEKCGKGFILKDKLVAHYVVHSEEKPFRCKYDCGFAAKTLGNCKKHEEARSCKKDGERSQKRKYTRRKPSLNNNRVEQNMEDEKVKFQDVKDEIMNDQQDEMDEQIQSDVIFPDKHEGGELVIDEGLENMDAEKQLALSIAIAENSFLGDLKLQDDYDADCSLVIKHSDDEMLATDVNMNEEAERPNKLHNTTFAEVETLEDIDLEDYIEEEILDEEEAEAVSGAADKKDINQDEVKVEAGLEKASFYVMVPGDEGEVGRGGGSDHFVKIEPLTRHIFRSETVAAEAEAEEQLGDLDDYEPV